MWTFLTNCPQSSTNAKGHRHLNKPRSSVAGVVQQTKQKSGLQEWGQLSKKKMSWGGLIQLGIDARLGQHKNMRSSCPKLPAQIYVLGITVLGCRGGVRKQAAQCQPSSLAQWQDAFMACLWSCVPSSASQEKKKSKLKKRVLVVAVCDLIYTTGGWNVTVLLKLKTERLQWVMANSH